MDRAPHSDDDMEECMEGSDAGDSLRSWMGSPVSSAPSRAATPSSVPLFRLHKAATPGGVAPSWCGAGAGSGGRAPCRTPSKQQIYEQIVAAVRAR